MPWKCIPFQGEKDITRRSIIQEKYSIRGIPQLIVINQEGKVLSGDARSTVLQQTNKAAEEWLKLIS